MKSSLTSIWNYQKTHDFLRISGGIVVKEDFIEVLQSYSSSFGLSFPSKKILKKSLVTNDLNSIFFGKEIVFRNMNHSVLLEKWSWGKYFANFNMETEPYLCPPESSVKLSFHTLPNATFTSNPSRTVMPSGGASLALVPGSSVEKILPKSWKRATEGYNSYRQTEVGSGEMLDDFFFTKTVLIWVQMW